MRSPSWPSRGRLGDVEVDDVIDSGCKSICQRLYDFVFQTKIIESAPAYHEIHAVAPFGFFVFQNLDGGEMGSGYK